MAGNRSLSQARSRTGLLRRRAGLQSYGGCSYFCAAQAHRTFPAWMDAGFRSCAHRLDDGNPGVPHVPNFAHGHAHVLLLTGGRLACAAGVLGRQAAVDSDIRVEDGGEFLR